MQVHVSYPAEKETRTSPWLAKGDMDLLNCYYTKRQYAISALVKKSIKKKSEFFPDICETE